MADAGTPWDPKTQPRQYARWAEQWKKFHPGGTPPANYTPRGGGGGSTASTSTPTPTPTPTPPASTPSWAAPELPGAGGSWWQGIPGTGTGGVGATAPTAPAPPASPTAPNLPVGSQIPVPKAGDQADALRRRAMSPRMPVPIRPNPTAPTLPGSPVSTPQRVY